MVWLFICGAAIVIRLGMQQGIWLVINRIPKTFMICSVCMQQLLFKMTLLILLVQKTWWEYATLETHQNQRHQTLIILLNFIVCLILEIPREIKLFNTKYIINIALLHISNHTINKKHSLFLYSITHIFIKISHVILQFSTYKLAVLLCPY